ncbi:MAG: site-specific integrase [Eubacterium sp.]|nr:site-specific integrase [Eubacterium sp.]
MMRQSVNMNRWETMIFPNNTGWKLAGFDEPDMTFADLLKLWLNNNRLNYKGATVAKYEHLIELHILPLLGEIRLSEMNSTMINQFLLFKLEHGRLDNQGGLSPSYVRSIMLIVNAALKFAAEEGLCAPLKTPICRPAPSKKELKIMGNEDQRRLEQYVLEHMDLTGVGVLLSLYCGLRVGEICALSWEDVDLEKDILHIRHTVSRSKSHHGMQLILERPKTNASLRDIPIPSVLVPLLRDMQNTTTSAFVISDMNSFLNPRTFEYRYHKLLKKAGITDVNFHALRHTFATRCIQAGVDIKSLSEVLGHSNTSITLNIYVHSSMEMKRAQLEKLKFIVED